MALSGSYDFVENRNEIITDALSLLRVIDPLEGPTPQQLSQASRFLNTLLRELHSEHIHLNLVTTQDLSLVQSTKTYMIPTGVSRILSVWLTVDNTTTPLDVYSQSVYDSILNKDVEGQPQGVYIENTTLYVYPVPSAAYTLTYRHEVLIDDLDATSDSLALPVKAFPMIISGLAYKMAKIYGVPQGDRLEIKSDFDEAKRIFRSGDTYRSGREIAAPNFIV